MHLILMLHKPLSFLYRSYKMTRKYTVEENGIIWYEENGFRVSFMADPANPDYQEYLNPSEAKIK
jgi:hypothetical protein